MLGSISYRIFFFRYVFPNLKSLVLAECPIRSLALEENRNLPSENDRRAKEEDHGQDNENMNHLDADEHTSSTEEKGNRIFESKVSYDRSESESESNGTTVRSPHDPFRMLRFLNVNGTLLSTWDEVERLARFPALKSLRIQGCPLFEVSDSFSSDDQRLASLKSRSPFGKRFD